MKLYEAMVRKRVAERKKTVAGSREPVAGKARRSLASGGALSNLKMQLLAMVRGIATALAGSPATGYRLPVPVFSPVRAPVQTRSRNR